MRKLDKEGKGLRHLNRGWSENNHLIRQGARRDFCCISRINIVKKFFGEGTATRKIANNTSSAAYFIRSMDANYR